MAVVAIEVDEAAAALTVDVVKEGMEASVVVLEGAADLALLQALSLSASSAQRPTIPCFAVGSILIVTTSVKRGLPMLRRPPMGLTRHGRYRCHRSHEVIHTANIWCRYAH